ncbi:hypothetical protein PgNI_11299 [Pyricularia grisea]|uniref:Uncharacterized protein n=1 Tax=Pyricularia grisea TaxID=148305 RepID=A0A6P8APT4_PYRGI|nr:hypothetical protein PgNI_11299 [Pyricularia grisea]TLD04028.1 hypothetical protein PgNI_11299 [Pyricularia grisea]
MVVAENDHTPKLLDQILSVLVQRTLEFLDQLLRLAVLAQVVHHNVDQDLLLHAQALLLCWDLLCQSPDRLLYLLLCHRLTSRQWLELDRHQLARLALLLLVVQQTLDVCKCPPCCRSPRRLSLLCCCTERDGETLRRCSWCCLLRLPDVHFALLLLQERVGHTPGTLHLGLLAPFFVRLRPSVCIVSRPLLGQHVRPTPCPSTPVAVVKVTALVFPASFVLGERAIPLKLISFAPRRVLHIRAITLLLSVQCSLSCPLTVRPLALRLQIELIVFSFLLRHFTSVQLLV